MAKGFSKRARGQLVGREGAVANGAGRSAPRKEALQKEATNRTAHHARVWVAALALSLLWALSSCSDARRVLASDAGYFPGERGRVVLVVHPGAGGRAQLLADVQPTVKAAADAGARLRAFVLRGGAAASMIEVTFSQEAGNGDFMPASKNPNGWKQDAGAFVRGAMANIQAMLGENPELDATGADLAGAVESAVHTASVLDGRGPRKVVLVTGGGVHQAADVDLIASHVTPANAEALAGRVPKLHPGVPVRLIGIGRFAAVPVEKDFSNGVIAWWHQVCPDCQFA